MTASPGRRLVRSREVTAFSHLGEVYIYHDLYGYILQMSGDVLQLLDAFAEPRDPSEVCTERSGAVARDQLEGYIATFEGCACLVEPATDERAPLADMFPIKSRWNVWHRDDAGKITIFTAWRNRDETWSLDEHQTAVWDAIDGETALSELAHTHGQVAIDLAVRLVHHDVQAIKLSPLAVSAWGKAIPPYVRSTMPHELLAGELSTAPELAAYHRQSIRDPDAQFDDRETTLSHLLRVNHPALGGRSYGTALAEALWRRGLARGGALRVLELGGGLGWVARDVARTFIERGAALSYEIVELSPALADAQRRRCRGLPVVVAVGDALDVELSEAAYDLVIANEMIGDLPAEQYARADIAAGRLHPVVAELGLDLADAPDPFYLNVGALELVARIRRWLAPGGAAIVTEFGQRSEYPRLSSHLDHPEMSIHFGHLLHAAERVGLMGELEFVIDLIDLDRGCSGLASTRSWFRSLRRLLARHGIELQKIGYTQAMFESLCAGKLDGAQFGDIRFEPIEDRLMGIVPHEFKALILRAPK